MIFQSRISDRDAVTLGGGEEQRVSSPEFGSPEFRKPSRTILKDHTHTLAYLVIFFSSVDSIFLTSLQTMNSKL